MYVHNYVLNFLISVLCSANGMEWFWKIISLLYILKKRSYPLIKKAFWQNIQIYYTQTLPITTNPYCVLATTNICSLQHLRQEFRFSQNYLHQNMYAQNQWINRNNILTFVNISHQSILSASIKLGVQVACMLWTIVRSK